jgi:hypothetical protein
MELKRKLLLLIDRDVNLLMQLKINIVQNVAIP